MDVTITLGDLAFWAAIFFTGIGAMLGLMGTWIKEFWRSDAAIKLLITDLIFAGTSAIIAALVKFLS